MIEMDDPKKIRICASCEWCAAEINSGGDFVCFCLHKESENYLKPVSLVETCGAWEDGEPDG